MLTVSEAITLVQTQIAFSNHSLDALERGLIPFASVGRRGEVGQVQLIAILLRACNCPEEWRLWVVGQFVGRELHSTKDVSMAEASAFLDWLLVGSDGKGASDREPCPEAVEVIGMMLMHVMAKGIAEITAREKGGERVQVMQQLGLC